MAFDLAADRLSLPIIFVICVTAFWVLIRYVVGSDAELSIIYDPLVNIVIASRRFVWDRSRITWFAIRLNCLCSDIARAIDSTG